MGADWFARLPALKPPTLGVVGVGVLIFAVGCAGRYLMLCHREGARPTLRGVIGFTFPWPGVASASSRIDLVFYVVNKLSHHLVLVTQIGLAVAGSQMIAGLLGAQFGGQAQPPGLAALALAYLAAFLPRDLAHYVVHYLHHKSPILWEFHKVHHSATYLSPLTTERTHPVEDQLFAIGEGVAMALALGLVRWRFAFSDADILVIAPLAIWVARMLVLTPLQHSQAPVHFGPLDGLFYSPSLHQAHHSCAPQHWDRNFGECLSVWDSLFGTYYRLGEDTPILGLPDGGHEAYQSLPACYLTPFARIAARFSAGRRRSAPARPEAVTSGS